METGHHSIIGGDSIQSHHLVPRALPS
jgi:hypothetical protein